jgi:hypothetical protein
MSLLPTSARILFDEGASSRIYSVAGTLNQVSRTSAKPAVQRILKRRYIKGFFMGVMAN